MKSANKTKTLALALFLFGMFALTPAVRAAEIWTDLEDYAPLEIVYISGSGFDTSTVITVSITGPDTWGLDIFSSEIYPEWVIWTFDDSGAFTVGYLKEKCEGEFTVTATDFYGNTATTTFTDGPIETTLLKPTLSATSIVLGGNVTVSGTLTVGTDGVLAGRTIRLQPNGTYTSIYTTTDSSGNYSFTYTPASAGSYYLVLTHNIGKG